MLPASSNENKYELLIMQKLEVIEVIEFCQLLEVFEDTY